MHPGILRFATFFALGFASLAHAAEAPPRPDGLRAPRHGGVYVVAHRGAHKDIPENTLAAYREAIALGCDFVEIDLRTTKDGAIVSVHNNTFEAYTGGAEKRKVSELSLPEIKALDIGSRVGPAWADERVPTFDEILELCHGKIGIYLDLKAAAVSVLAEKVKAHGMERDVVWYLSPVQAVQLRAECPACLPMPEGGPAAMLPRILEKAKPPLIAATWDNFSAEYPGLCHAAGALVICDDGGPETWERLLAWGVDGIQTDDPAGLIQRLSR